MGFFTSIADSADLMNGMAERLGADLAEAVARDPENEAAKYRTMVMRCSHCTDRDACAELQGSHAHLGGAPGYCRNKAVLEQLRG